MLDLLAFVMGSTPNVVGMPLTALRLPPAERERQSPKASNHALVTCQATARHAISSSGPLPFRPDSQPGLLAIAKSGAPPSGYEATRNVWSRRRSFGERRVEVGRSWKGLGLMWLRNVRITFVGQMAYSGPVSRLLGQRYLAAPGTNVKDFGESPGRTPFREE